MPVRGDFVITMYLPPVGVLVPVNGPVANINLFSELSASVFGSTSSIKILVPKPLPPINFKASSRFNSSFLIVFSVKFTLRIVP
ncbi:hypothetical protein DSECCO2_467380 [anaerobic digester metagenome]